MASQLRKTRRKLQRQMADRLGSEAYLYAIARYTQLLAKQSEAELTEDEARFCKQMEREMGQ